jgi:hypothetical protein
MVMLTQNSCAPEANWPQGTSTLFASPSDTPVPEAIATAVRWWTTREPTALSRGPVPVSLAPSLDAAKAPLADLLPSCDVITTNEPNALRILAVRMHHASAQVDIDAPHPGRGRQLITIDMKKYLLTPWEVTGANWWRFNGKQLERITSEAVAANKAAAEVSPEAAIEPTSPTGSPTVDPKETAAATDGQ